MRRAQARGGGGLGAGPTLAPPPPGLKLRWRGEDGGFVVDGLRQEACTSADEALECLEVSASPRAAAPIVTARERQHELHGGTSRA